MVVIWLCRTCGSDWATPRVGCIDCGGKQVEAADQAPEPWGYAGWFELFTTSPSLAAARLIQGRRCPWCRGRVSKWAAVCDNCRHELTAPNKHAFGVSGFGVFR